LRRFDFSCNQNIRKDELESVERAVNDVIRFVPSIPCLYCDHNVLPAPVLCATHREALEVRSEEMPLQLAQQIPGLRAVFGEVYPDPVRVVSMRPTVRSILFDQCI
jgi:alanyl-tRNA synthetase